MEQLRNFRIRSKKQEKSYNIAPVEDIQPEYVPANILVSETAIDDIVEFKDPDGTIKEKFMIKEDPEPTYNIVNYFKLSHSEIIQEYCDSSNNEDIGRDGFEKYNKAMHQESQEKIFKCNECSYENKSKKNLQSHVLRHRDFRTINMYRCTECTYQSRFKHVIKRHELQHKKKSEIVLYTCGKCTYQTMHKHNLQNHILLHEDKLDDKMFKCDKCNYKTNLKKYLQKHQVTHKDASETTMFTCDICSYKSIKKGNLRRHIMLVHRDAIEEKTFRCTKCSYKSKDQAVVKKHFSQHKQNVINKSL